MKCDMTHYSADGLNYIDISIDMIALTLILYFLFSDTGKNNFASKEIMNSIFYGRAISYLGKPLSCPARIVLYNTSSA